MDTRGASVPLTLAVAFAGATTGVAAAAGLWLMVLALAAVLASCVLFVQIVLLHREVRALDDVSIETPNDGTPSRLRITARRP